MQRIDSTHSTWIFDSERMRFRRLPKGTDPSSPSLESDWEPYFALDIDSETGAFTVALNEDRTRILRAWRADATPPAPTGPDDTTELGTNELRLETSHEGNAEA